MGIAQAKSFIGPLWRCSGPAKIKMFQFVHLACLRSFEVFLAAPRGVIINLRTYLRVR